MYEQKLLIEGQPRTNNCRQLFLKVYLVMLCFCSETIHDLFASQLCISFRREQSFSVRFLDQSSPIVFINLFKETDTIFALMPIFFTLHASLLKPCIY